MMIFKKTALVILALSCDAVFAGTLGSVCMEGSVSVPCAKQGWNIGVQALYLKPSYSNSFAWQAQINDQVNYVDLPSRQARTETLLENNLAWNWGFQLEASYHFNTGNDLNLNWYHLGRKTTNSHFITQGTTTRGSDTALELEPVSLSAEPSWDAVNLEFAQHVDFGQRKKIRFHAGVQYAQIKTTLSAYATDTVTLASTPIESAIEQITTTTNYNGFGPRVGADMSYQLGKGFAVFAKGATAILTGKSKYATTAIADIAFFSPQPALINQAVSSHGSRTAFVPELEAKLGLDYTYVISHGDLILNVGYLWINYFNAQSSFKQDSNFGVQGPFVELKWLGAV